MAASKPTTFELAINLTTAQALGLKMPQIVTARADKAYDLEVGNRGGLY